MYSIATRIPSIPHAVPNTQFKPGIGALLLARQSTALTSGSVARKAAPLKRELIVKLCPPVGVQAVPSGTIEHPGSGLGIP